LQIADFQIIRDAEAIKQSSNIILRHPQIQWNDNVTAIRNSQVEIRNITFETSRNNDQQPCLSPFPEST